MSTTAYQNNHSSTSFPQRKIRTSSTNAMTNDRSRVPLQKNHFPHPIPPIGESPSSTNLKSSPHSLSSETPTPTPRSRADTNASIKSPKEIYTFSNPPRELERKTKYNRLRQRILSAPEENSLQVSSYSKPKEQKALSANVPLIPRSRDDYDTPQISPRKRDEQQKISLDDLIKQEKKSKVPKAVQNRRVLLLFHRSSPIQEASLSPRSNDQQIQENSISQLSIIDSANNMEPEVADSMQLAAILANMQDGWSLNGTSPEPQQRVIDPTKYDFVVSNPLDTATFRLSPRTLKPEEEVAARSRFLQNNLYEMRQSANAQMPPLMLSIVPENDNTSGNSTGNDKTFTFRFNTADTIKKESAFDDVDPFESTMNSEQIQLCYDATLNGFYDPKTGKYYELTTA